MNTYTKLGFTCFLLSVVSCKKDTNEPRQFEGVVFQYNTETLISDAKVDVEKCSIEPDWWSGACYGTVSIGQHLESDANGKFKYEETAYGFEVSKDGYWRPGGFFDERLSTSVKLCLVKNGWIRININNLNHVYDGDSIAQVSAWQNVAGGPLTIEHSNPELIGNAVQKSFKFLAYGDAVNYITFSTTNASLPVKDTTEIFVPSNDTAVVNIEY